MELRARRKLVGRLRVINNICLAFSYKALTRLFLAHPALRAGYETTHRKMLGSAILSQF